MSSYSDEGNNHTSDPANTMVNIQVTAMDDDHPSAKTAAARRMKKRELDRKCQRMARDRTKARMAYLEGLVEDFQRQDSSGHIAALMSQLAEVRKERDTLARTLQSIAKLSKDYQETPSCTAARAIGTASEQPLKSTSPVLSANMKQIAFNSNLLLRDNPQLRGSTQQIGDITRQDGTPFGPTLTFPWEAGTQSSASGLQTDSFGLGALPTTFPEMVGNTPAGELAPPTMSTTRFQRWEPILPRTEEFCDCSTPPYVITPARRRNHWCFANEVLTSTAASHARSLIQKEVQELVEDVLFRAIADGWESVE